ncbi:MAG: type IX secretion system sortase PorU [candidate division Zixibacteria bacterium]
MRRLQIEKFLFLAISAIFFIWASSALAVTIYDEDVIVTKADINGALITYNVPEPGFSLLDFEDNRLYSMEIARTAQARREGQVEIPVKLVSLAVPPEAQVRIQIVDSQYERIPFKRIAPFFARENEEEFRKAHSASTAPLIPPVSPYIVVREEIRGLNIAKIAIPTARYNPLAEDLAALKNITLKIEFIGGKEELAEGYRHPGATFDRIFRKILANYDIGRNWFMPRENIIAGITETATSFDSSQTWIRIELTSEGIYKFGWLEFSAAGIDPLSLDPSTLRIFYGGGRELSLSNFDPRPELVEIPIEVLGGDDGQFDNGDYVVFFADAVDSWEYSDDLSRFVHYRNHYTGKNVYWLTTEGSFQNPPLRFEAVDGSPIGSFDVSVETYTARYHKEEEWIFFRYTPNSGLSDYYDWYWGFGKDFTSSAQTFDMVPGQSAEVIIRHRFGSPTLRVNGGSIIAPSTDQNFSSYFTGGLSEGLNGFDLHSSVDFYLDYINVFYPRWLKLSDENLLFAQPDTSGVIEYNLTDVISPYILLDIADKNSPLKITGGRLEGTSLAFYDTVSVDSHKQYYISSINRLKSPSAVSYYDVDNLRDMSSPDNRADEIIITYDGFYDQALALAEHRSQSYNMPTRVVRLSDVYNQFSYGLIDAVAIRDFLKYAYENWPAPAPTFALLLGDGHYDYRNNLGSGNPVFLPPFENDRTMSDEHFIYFGNRYYLDSDSSGAPDMIISRIPANSVSDADDMVGKTIDYDADPDLGSWRNRIVIAADDNTSPRTNYETYHTNQAETLSNLHTPNRFEVAKIYLVEYPARNLEKPEAREALIGAFNQGSLIIEWICHGSPGWWADEHIFRRSEDIPRLVNGKRLPLVFTASCSIGFFDDPTIESFGEELIRKRSRGAVSVISATRVVFSSPNVQFNYLVFDELLYEDSVGIGEAMYMAKYLRQLVHLEPNDRAYVLFGDPALLLQFPKFDVRFTSAPDSLVALSESNVAGEIVDNAGNLMSDFNGTVWVTAKDGTITRSVIMRDRNNNPLPPPNNTISFLNPGATIFTGPVDVIDGRFSTAFFVPKDISYGSQGAKIYAYSENGDYDAVGVVDSILVSGSVPAVEDTTGPTILLFADGREFSSGVTLAGSGFMLTARIEDEHGINITGQLGHGIVLQVDHGEAFEADITGSFEFNRGDYRIGSVDIVMPALSPGEHRISLKAWDNFNNSSLIEKTIEVVSTENLQLSEVMNYPNPVRKGDYTTSFQYCLNSDVDRVTIKVFTESGAKIKSIDINSVEFTQMGCHQIDWNVRDGDGDQLANGVYIFQVVASGISPEGKTIQAKDAKKLVILR